MELPGLQGQLAQSGSRVPLAPPGHPEQMVQMGPRGPLDPPGLQVQLVFKVRLVPQDQQAWLAQQVPLVLPGLLVPQVPQAQWVLQELLA